MQVSREELLSVLMANGGAEVIQQERSRRSYHDFLMYTHPSLVSGWFVQHLAGVLQEFYEDLIAGRNPRLMITAPPRHGKSEITSRYFPAWVFGKRPATQIIGTSYSASLAARMNRDIQRILSNKRYGSVFPATYLNSKNVSTIAGSPLRNSEIFEIVGHGGAYRAAGVGGGITGMGADIALIDDPFKDFAEAHSEVRREVVWEWYRSTLYTRLSPMGGVLLINTRWHTDDLSGRLLALTDEDSDGWRCVNFPAIAEENEKHRKEGEALFPERYPLEKLQRIKTNLGSYLWDALYQQHPVPSDGAVFNRKHWQFYKALPQIDEVVMSVDCSFKDLKTSDFVALHVWGVRGANKYLLYRVRARMGFSATVTAIRAAKALYPQTIAILVEDKANGSAVIETLRTEIPGVIAINPEGGKLARAYAMQPEQEAGNLFLPDPTLDAKIEEFLSEVSLFPSAKNDDQVDAMTQCINWLRARNASSGLLQFYKEAAEEARAAAPAQAAQFTRTQSSGPGAFMQALGQ